MKSNLKKIKDCQMVLEVEVEPELVENRFQSVLKEFQKSAALPGFREGRAPLDLVEKKFLKEAQEEVLKSLIPEAYHASIATHKIAPVTLPSISEIKLERGKKLTFHAQFEKAPEIPLKNYKGIKIKKVAMEVGLDEIEKGIRSLLDSKAELVPLLELRAIQKGDFITADVDVWKDDQYIPARKNVVLTVEPTEGDNFFDQVQGADVNDVREISANGTPAYKVWIKAIQKKSLPDLDEVFAQSFGKSSVEELKEAVRKDLVSYKQQESMSKMREELFEKLLATNSFSVPEGLVQKQKQHLMDQVHNQFHRSGLPESQFESEKSRLETDAQTRAYRQVRLYFVLQKISELEGIEADEMEVERRLEALVEESKQSMGEVRHTFEDDVRDSLRETKTVEFLLANAKLEETA